MAFSSGVNLESTKFISPSFVRSSSLPVPESWKILGTEVGDYGFEAIIPSGRAFFAVPYGAKWNIKVVANYENIFWFNLIEVGESADAGA